MLLRLAVVILLLVVMVVLLVMLLVVMLLLLMMILLYLSLLTLMYLSQLFVNDEIDSRRDRLMLISWLTVVSLRLLRRRRWWRWRWHATRRTSWSGIIVVSAACFKDYFNAITHFVRKKNYSRK